jgi:hypothetical protein
VDAESGVDNISVNEPTAGSAPKGSTRLRALAVVGLICGMSALSAQSTGTARLLITVSDTSGAVVRGAQVTAVGLDDATKAAAPLVAKTNDRGLAVLEGLAAGGYRLTVEFPGFAPGVVPNVRLQNGDNRQAVVLRVRQLEETVTVAGDPQVNASARADTTFGVSLSPDLIDALPDNPADALRQLLDLAGPDAIIRVDSFEGQSLPPKAQIKSIHITRDQFAAESISPGSTFVDVITQPGLGPIRGTATMSFRHGSMSARSPFTPTKGAEQIRNYAVNVGGALVKEKSNFSLSVNARDEYSTPNLNVALPGGTRSEVLSLRQPQTLVAINGRFDYALTRDQTLGVAYSQNVDRSRNLGIGAFDLPERAYAIDENNYTLRVLEAGPIGRRAFHNTRVMANWSDETVRSTVEAPTVVVQDAFTSGGAQRAGGSRSRRLQIASDLDYIRGIHSWRTGVALTGNWTRTDSTSNYLGTYVFSSLSAYEAGQPLLHTRQVGDPAINYFYGVGGIYFQDDIRVRPGLTVSLGVRYSVDTIRPDYTLVQPRLGLTWAPFKSGQTTVRLNAGTFPAGTQPGVLVQTLRFDGIRQRELVITNPPYPDPGSTGVVAPANLYRQGARRHTRTTRYAAGVAHRVSPRFGVNVLYNYIHWTHWWRGRNLNPLVDGRRPDPSVANIIETFSDGEVIWHELNLNFNLSLLGSTPAASRARFNWRRLAVIGSYAYVSSRANILGPFYVPPTGTLDTEWGRGASDMPYRFNVSLTSTQLRNLTAILALNASDGSPYTWTTGFDDNHDGILNDRPVGVGIRTLRAASQWTLNGRFTYAVPLSGPGFAAVGGVAGPPRYRVGVYVSFVNLTNHANYGGYSGIQTSPFFEQPTTVLNPRKVDIGLNIGF